MSDTNMIAYITDDFIIGQATRPVKKKLKFGQLVELRFYWIERPTILNSEIIVLVLNSNVLAANSQFDGFLGCVVSGYNGIGTVAPGYVGTFPNACVERILNAEDAVSALQTNTVSDDFDDDLPF